MNETAHCGQPGVVPKIRERVHQATNFFEPGSARRHVIIIFPPYESFPVPSSVAYEKCKRR